MVTLITGATGFVGSHLIRRLLEEGQKVRALVRPNGRRAALEELPVEIAEGDVRDPEAVRRAANGAESVFHLAAMVHAVSVSDSAFYEVNVRGTELMLQASLEAGVRRFVHCSTTGVLGHIAKPPADESSPTDARDIYQRTKLEGELLALRYFHEQGLPVVVARPAGVYGPGDRRLYKLFYHIATGRFRMVGNGRTLFHPIYVDDLVEGLILCQQKDEAVGEVFILAGDRYLTLNELAEAVAAAVEVDLPRGRIPLSLARAVASACELIWKPFRVDPPLFRRRVDFFTKNRAFDISKARAKLGFAPRVSLKEGLRITAAWYREAGWLPP